MVTDEVNITIDVKYKVACGLPLEIFIFEFGHTTGQGQNYAYFDCECFLLNFWTLNSIRILQKVTSRINPASKGLDFVRYHTLFAIIYQLH